MIGRASIAGVVLLAVGVMLWRTGSTPAGSTRLTPAPDPVGDASPLPTGDPSEARADRTPVPSSQELEDGTAVRSGDVVVRVDDESGQPIEGIPVSLWLAIPGGPSAPVGIGVTDRHGLVIIRPGRNLSSADPSVALERRVVIPLPSDARPRATVDRPTTEDDPIVLVMTAAHLRWLAPLVVEVRGAPPLGAVPVELRATMLDVDASNKSFGVHRTGEDGRVELSLMNAYHEQAEVSGFGVRFGMEVVCLAPIPDMAPARFDLDDPDDRRVIIDLPPRATIEVETRLPDGSVTDARVGAWLGRSRLPGWPRSTEDGVATMEHVGLGATLAVNASKGEHETASMEIVAPTSPGVTQRHAITLGPAWPALTFRVIDEHGAPLGNDVANASFAPADETKRLPRSGPIRTSRQRVETDTNGRARVVVRGNAARREGLLLEVSTGRRLRGHIDGDPARIGSTAIPHPLRTGEDHDLGDVRLSPMPLLVSGLVVDERRRPVPSARLYIRYPVGESWYNLPGSVTLSGPGGRFEIQFEEPIPAVRVSATKGDDLAKSIEVRAGTRDVVLVLRPEESVERPPGQVRGSLSPIAGDVPFQAVRVVLRDAQDREREAELFQRFFHFDGLRPGVYHVDLRAEGTGRLLHRIEYVVVPDGWCKDARLLDIDLDPYCAPLRLRLRDAEGAWLGPTAVTLHDGDDRPSRMRTDSQGRLFTLVPRDGRRLTVEVAGHHPVEVVPAAEEQVVLLVKIPAEDG